MHGQHIGRGLWRWRRALGSCRSVPCYLHPTSIHNTSPTPLNTDTDTRCRLEGLRHSRGVPDTFFYWRHYLLRCFICFCTVSIDFTNNTYFGCVKTESPILWILQSSSWPVTWAEPSSDLTQIQAQALASSSASSLQFCSVPLTNGVNPWTQLKVASAFQSKLRKPALKVC